MGLALEILLEGDAVSVTSDQERRLRAKNLIEPGYLDGYLTPAPEADVDEINAILLDLDVEGATW